jgi:hypothetical protein
MEALSIEETHLSAINRRAYALDRIADIVELKTRPSHCDSSEKRDVEAKLTWNVSKQGELIETLCALPPMIPAAFPIPEGVEESSSGLAVEPVTAVLPLDSTGCPFDAYGIAFEWLATVNGSMFEIVVKVRRGALCSALLPEHIEITENRGALSPVSYRMGFAATAEDPLAFPQMSRLIAKIFA